MADSNGSGYCYGLDIGGSKIELVACDAAMRIVHRQRIDTPHDDYDAFLAEVQGLVAAADAALGATCEGVGIGLPGMRNRASGCQLSANVPALTGRQVGADLQARLRRPLRLGNDLQCFALSEAHGGAADGYPSMCGVILGTGAGGGFCVDGRLVGGANGIAGEWGHWPIPASLLAKHQLPLLDCGCGLRGCLERYVSGSGLAALHRHLGGASPDAAAVIASAQSGDVLARRALDIHLDLLGHAFASLLMAMDPHVIVIGGGLSNYQPLFGALPAAIEPHLFRGVRMPPIVPPKFGDAGGARGAALLVRRRA